MGRLIRKISDGRVFVWTEVLANKSGFEEIKEEKQEEQTPEVEGNEKIDEEFSLENMDKMGRPELIKKAGELGMKDAFKKKNVDLIMWIHEKLTEE